MRLDRLALTVYQLRRDKECLEHQIQFLRGENERLHSKMFAPRPANSGWWVLVKLDGEKWEPVCCVNEYDERWEYDELPEWSQILPIADPDEVPEWVGF